MAYLDAHEEEQVTKLKNFFARFGKYILIACVIVLIGYIINSIWNWKVQKDAALASLKYEEFLTQVNSPNSDRNQVYKIIDQLEKEYPRIIYSAYASIWGAKIASLNKDPNKAITLLNWVINNSKDTGLINIARLNLAHLYIDQKRFDLANGILRAKHDSAFDLLYYLAKGDLNIARDSLDKAQEDYKEALKIIGNENTDLAQVIKLKLQAAGGTAS